MAILDVLDKEVVKDSHVAKLLKMINLGHFARMVCDPDFDRWVDPVLRSIMYLKADRFASIWHPMGERLEGRFGTKCDLLPPFVRFEDYDFSPVTEINRSKILTELGLDQDSLIYFVNGTIYKY
ncbi:hypothetical protein [Luteolibacter sp. AS25]|uniref:hypothetical protein n=1 Tax=Luteolibacter sp. AS25 TaxID=3135776 RepID=UPI00398A648A